MFQRENRVKDKVEIYLLNTLYKPDRGIHYFSH